MRDGDVAISSKYGRVIRAGITGRLAMGSSTLQMRFNQCQIRILREKSTILIRIFDFLEDIFRFLTKSFVYLMKSSKLSLSLSLFFNFVVNEVSESFRFYRSFYRFWFSIEIRLYVERLIPSLSLVLSAWFVITINTVFPTVRFSPSLPSPRESGRVNKPANENTRISRNTRDEEKWKKGRSEDLVETGETGLAARCVRRLAWW